jgi:hypothetical protein
MLRIEKCWGSGLHRLQNSWSRPCIREGAGGAGQILVMKIATGPCVDLLTQTDFVAFCNSGDNKALMRFLEQQ